MTQNPNKTVDLFRWLTEGELDSFREDYRELEKEIQSFFRAYYISGLILVAAWLTGPQSKPLLELALGNGGYNIYAPIGIALLNVVSTISLIYKSISIHEVTQFAARYSKPDSAANYWERWRRSSENYAKFTRPFYSPLLFMVPFGLSCLILIPTGKILYGKPSELLNQIKKYQVPASITDLPTRSQPAQAALNNPPNTESGSDLTVQERERIARQRMEEEREAYATQIERVFWWATGWFWITVVLHAIPFGLGVFNAFVIPKRWEHLSQAAQETSLDVVSSLAAAPNSRSQSQQSLDTASQSESVREIKGRDQNKRTHKDQKRTDKK